MLSTKINAVKPGRTPGEWQTDLRPMGVPANELNGQKKGRVATPPNLDYSVHANQPVVDSSAFCIGKQYVADVCMEKTVVPFS